MFVSRWPAQLMQRSLTRLLFASRIQREEVDRGRGGGVITPGVGAGS